MSSTHDERDEERDWPEENPPHPEKDPPPHPEAEDDAGRLPTRYHARARSSSSSRRRGKYRPPSELDHD